MFAVINRRAGAVQHCGKSSAGNYCNSESQADTPCKTIRANRDVRTQTPLPLSLIPTVGLQLRALREGTPLPPQPPSPRHHHCPQTPVSAAAGASVQHELSLLSCVTVIHNDIEQLPFLHTTHDPSPRRCVVGGGGDGGGGAGQGEG